jgi:hypothetical protein
MIAWALLLAGTLSGAYVLLRPERFPFRGATLLGFLLLTLGMTSPLALYPRHMMLASGMGADAFIGVWDLWWTRVAATLGADALETAWLFHPHGTSLALHTNALTYGVASLPVQALLAPGDPTSAAPVARYPEALFLTYNLILIASFTLTGYFTYRLAREETGHDTASVLAGALFAFTHFRFANTVRLHAIATEFLVLATWAWVVLLRRPGSRALALWLGATVLLVYASLEYAAYALPLFLVLAIAPAWRGPRPGDRPAPGAELRARFLAGRGPRLWLGGGIAGAALLMFPLVRALARHAHESPTRFDPRLVQHFSADLFDFFLPNPRHPLWGAGFAEVTAGFHRGDGGFGLSLGWIALGLLAVGALALLRARRDRRWFWGFVVFWVLALGPRLHVGGGVLSGLPLPQDLLSRAAPWLAASRTPIRYAAPAGLCLALAVAAGWARRDRARPLARALPALALGLLLLESLAAPLPLVEVPVPAVYREIDSPPGAATLAHAPGIPAREELLYQTVHRQRLAANLDNAIPLRSRRARGGDPDLFERPEWTALTRRLGAPGAVAALPAPQREALARDLSLFLERHAIRWIVVPRSRPVLNDDGRGFTTKRVMEDAAYDAFLENLQLLEPLRQEDSGEDALFEFEVPDAAPAPGFASR